MWVSFTKRTKMGVEEQNISKILDPNQALHHLVQEVINKKLNISLKIFFRNLNIGIYICTTSQETNLKLMGLV